ncbi:MAG: translocation and assembly module TamB, partial [Candidatus Atribacteria bacterium]|nr:translocation and assembly module TamB [Candidatus Atribacteria bacterium]
IEVKGINLEQLSKKSFSYPVSGVTDIVINLDTQKNLWFFHSRDLSFSVQDFNFQGEVEGKYDGKGLIVDKLHLQESTGGIEVDGKLKWEEKMLSGELKGKVDRVFSFPYGTLQLKGEANISLFSKEGEPYWQGEARGEGEIWREGKKYAYFSGVQGTIEGYEIQLEKGNLHTAGLNWVVAGVISRETSEIRLSGGGELDIPEKDNIGLSKIESNVVIKVDDGKINIQGEAKIFDGWGDFTERGSAENYSSLFSQLEDSLEKIPLSLELTLYTGNKVRIKTRFLDLGMEGKLIIRIEDGKINGEGKLEVREGNYNLVGTKISLTGYITFSPLYGLNPQVNLYGKEVVKGYHIFLEATGPVNDYKVTLKSEPFLSEEEILSLLFLGEEDAYLTLDDINWQPLLWKVGQLLWGNKIFPGGGFLDGIDIKFLSSKNYGFHGVRLEKGIGENSFIGYTQDLSGEGNSSWDFEINFDKEWSFKIEGDTTGEMNWMLEFNTKF